MYGSPWHVLHVISNHEKRVAQHLVVRSVEHYLPLYTERVKWTDRTVVAERPLFSGYVFVRFSAQTRLSVISTPGVLRLLGNEETDMVSCAELDKIRDGLASGLLLRSHPCLAVGTRVRVRGGVFAGVEGVVTELRHQCRVIIALAAVRQYFSLEVELDDLEVLKKPVDEPWVVKPLHSVMPAGFSLARYRGQMGTTRLTGSRSDMTPMIPTN
jgi:transcription antitermination factor NusG